MAFNEWEHLVLLAYDILNYAVKHQIPLDYLVASRDSNATANP